MRRRKLIPLLGLTGLSVLHGYADSAAAQKFAPSVAARYPTTQPSVVDMQIQRLPSVNDLLDQVPTAPRRTPDVNGPQLERLPAVAPPPIDTLPVETYPSTTPPAAARRIDRLPPLSNVSHEQQKSDTVELNELETVKLNEPERPSTPAPTISVMPQVVKIVTENKSVEPAKPTIPERRFVESKPPKPPLPKLQQTSLAAPSGSQGWLATGNALTAVSQRADGMIDRGFRLAEKGAFYSAKTEFRQALRTVAQALDTHFETNEHSESLEAGWLALDEADDFSAHSQRGPRVNVELIVDSHQTDVLKHYDVSDVSPVVAMQHYFTFAQERLVQAGGRAPVAARALHGLGKIHMVLGEKLASAGHLHGPKAMAFQQAAMTTDPSNYLAANELGVLLARFGKLYEARNVLQYSASFYPLPETWQNLSIVHQRLGESQLAAQSVANWQVALQQAANADPATRQASNRSMVQWVPPQAFIGEHPASTNLPTMPAEAAPQQPPVQAKKKSGFLWW